MTDEDDAEVLIIDPISRLDDDNLWGGLQSWQDCVTMAMLYLRHREGSTLSQISQFLTVFLMPMVLRNLLASQEEHTEIHKSWFDE